MKNDPTAHHIADDVRNLVDFLWNAELLIDSSAIAESQGSVSWHSRDKNLQFLDSRKHISAEQYRRWIAAGHYTCVLFDGAIIQLSYSLEQRKVTKHRLAYIPCPWEIDTSLIDAGYALDEVFEQYATKPMAMRTSLRFDLDLRAAREGHPASHMTFNAADCRIACTGALHPLRFLDFLFKNFYAAYWRQHRNFFAAAPFRHLGDPVILPGDLDDMHLAWNARLRASA